MADFFREKRERIRARSLVVATLNSVYVQLPELAIFFGSLSKIIWSEETLPVAFSLSKNLRQIDTSLFDKVRENLLRFDVELANAILAFEIRVLQLNRVAKEVAGNIAEDSPMASGRWKPANVVNYLKLYSKYNSKQVEFANAIGELAAKLRDQLFAKTKKIIVDWTNVDRLTEEAQVALAEIRSPVDAESQS